MTLTKWNSQLLNVYHKTNMKNFLKCSALIKIKSYMRLKNSLERNLQNPLSKSNNKWLEVRILVSNHCKITLPSQMLLQWMLIVLLIFLNSQAKVHNSRIQVINKFQVVQVMLKNKKYRLSTQLRKKWLLKTKSE